jgi:serine-type D-Ala-D-Ala carboxypeptidase/endopeptidase
MSLSTARGISTLAFLFAITVVPELTYAQSEPKAWTSEQIEQILKTRIKEDGKGVGMVVGILDAEGKRVISYGSVTTKDLDAKVDGDTVFEIGSVSKVFTSLLLAEMVSQGEISLTDPVSKFLPKSVAIPTRKEKEITLLDLSTHTSSLPRMPANAKPADPENPYADYTVEQLYAFLSGCKLTTSIGTKYEYSNLGAGLLGHALALHADTSFESLVSSKICKELGMTSTTIALSDDMKRRMATGYDEALDEQKNWDIPVLAGAGAIRSTVNDMMLFLAANMGKSDTALAGPMNEQHKPQRKAGPKMSIGLGWHILAGPSGDIVWHNGQTGGYHAFIGFDKKRGVGIVLLSNAAVDCDDIGFHLIDSRLALKKQSKSRMAVKVDPKIYDDYVGEYEIIPQFVLTVTREEDKLKVQATGQPKFEVFPESETKFFLKVVEAQISFVKDDQGNVTQLILHQNGANQAAKKR